MPFLAFQLSRNWSGNTTSLRNSTTTSPILLTLESVVDGQGQGWQKRWKSLFWENEQAKSNQIVCQLLIMGQLFRKHTRLWQDYYKLHVNHLSLRASGRRWQCPSVRLHLGIRPCEISNYDIQGNSCFWTASDNGSTWSSHLYYGCPWCV